MILGFDIGGTKCAVIVAEEENGALVIKNKKKIPTDLTVLPEVFIDRLIGLAETMADKEKISAVGISCGGPLDAENGIILSPPNLKGWDCVHIVKRVQAHFPVPVRLQNDANACAVAEWKFGAGRGTKNMVFLTFGTGLGAGLILDGRLYAGTNGNAGEVGHIRLEKTGPVGFGKAGSFEGFCSGGGLAQLGGIYCERALASGITPQFAAGDMTAKAIAEAAEQGDETALAVYKACGEKLGMGLSVLIDLLNPERIVLGSIFARSGHLLWDAAKAVIDREALAAAAAVCEIVPAKLGEEIGDYAAIGVALLEENA